MENINEKDIEKLIIQEINKFKETIIYIEETKELNESYKKKVEEIYLSYILLKKEITEHISAVNKNIDTKINDSTALLKNKNTNDFEYLKKSNKVILDTFKDEISLIKKENDKLKKIIYFVLAICIFFIIKSC